MYHFSFAEWIKVLMLGVKICFQVVSLLLCQGAEPNARDNWNYTPLHEAAIKGKIDVCIGERIKPHSCKCTFSFLWSFSSLSLNLSIMRRKHRQKQLRIGCHGVAVLLRRSLWEPYKPAVSSMISILSLSYCCTVAYFFILFLHERTFSGFKLICVARHTLEFHVILNLISSTHQMDAVISHYE